MQSLKALRVERVAPKVLGVASAVAVLPVVISAQVAETHSTGFPMAVRLAGSWIAAAGVLSLGLLLSSKPDQHETAQQKAAPGRSG